MTNDARFPVGSDLISKGFDPDLPPRRGQLFPSTEEVQRSQPDGAVDPQELDGPDDLAIDETDVVRGRIPPVAWPASDADAPDYAHLLPEGREPAVGDRRFELGAEELELLIDANAFEPEGYEDRFVFALRGARLVDGDHAEGVRRIELEDVRPDHRDFRCVIGYYSRGTRRLSAFKASTVPNVKYMTNYYQWRNNIGGNRSIAANMLPTGCYVFRVGAHGGGRIDPALRLTDPDRLGEDGSTTVVRTHNDLTYTTDDLWDKCTPYDHVHCAHAYDSFSSAGCLTICGPDGAGPWGRFQSVLEGMRANTRLDLVLLTGREASIAAYLVQTERGADGELVGKLLERLRTGSTGEAVGRLQQRIGVTPTGYFGGSTKKALAGFQRGNQLRADGIYSAALDARLAWGVVSQPATIWTPAPAEQPAAVVQPHPAVAPDALERPETLETPLEIAQVESEAGPAEQTEMVSVARAAAAERAEAAERSVPAAALGPGAGAAEPRLVLTAEALQRFAPDALPHYRDALVAGNEVLELYGISESPLRLCHFLAQVACQCGRLTVLEENLDFDSAMRVRTVWPTRFPTVASAVSYLGEPHRLAERVYGDRFANLPGDGWRYRGRGLVQITGRASYREMGRMLGIALEDEPDLACRPEHALTIACETWMSKQLAGEREMSRLAELNKLDALTYRMAGSYFDLDERRNAFAEAWAIWGEGDRPDRVLEANVLERGDRAGRVEELNARLKALGLFDGITDEPPQHVFTLATYKALQRLQGGQGFALSGVAGADTWTALDDAIEHGPGGPMGRVLSGRRSRWPPGASTALDLTGRRLAEVRGWSAALAFFALAFAGLYMFASIEPGRFAVSAYWMPLLFAGIVLVGGLAMWLAARLPSARSRRRSVLSRVRAGSRTSPPSGGFVVGEEEPVRQGFNVDAPGK